MYINDLGIGRSVPTYHNSSAGQVLNTAGRKKTDSYAAVMKKALEGQRVAAVPTFASAGDIIIKEAFEKMKTDPEWEASVMDKVKDYYTGNYSMGSSQTSYLNWMGQNSLQNYLVQGLIGGQSMYSPYSFGSLAAGSLGSSLFGDWQL